MCSSSYAPSYYCTVCVPIQVLARVPFIQSLFSVALANPGPSFTGALCRFLQLLVHPTGVVVSDANVDEFLQAQSTAGVCTRRFPVREGDNWKGWLQEDAVVFLRTCLAKVVEENPLATDAHGYTMHNCWV